MELRPGSPGALVDSPDGVLLLGAPPRALVRIEARLELAGQEWSCSGEYAADDEGGVDTARAASSGGSYSGVDPFGLFWSANLTGSYDWSSSALPMRVTLRATCEEQVVEASYARGVLAPGVTRTEVGEDGVVGSLYLPPGDAPAPGVVLLGGSEGGVPGGADVALLAGHGLAALAVAVWGYPGGPEHLHNIDIEVVGTACDWLRARDGVADERPAVVGVSRGGELALLAGSLLPEKVGAVISVVGSGAPWGAFGADIDVNEVAWRFRGEAVPKLWEDEDDPDSVLDDPEAVAAAEIPVERTDGPVLLLSGEDDQMWPSTRLSAIAEHRAARTGAADRITHVSYPDAGHVVGVPPGYPTRTEGVHPVDGSPYSSGGTRAGNQAARLDSWRRQLEFLGAPVR